MVSGHLSAISGTTPETHFIVAGQVTSVRLIENSLAGALEVAESLGAATFIIDTAPALRMKGHVWAVYRAQPGWKPGSGKRIDPLKLFRTDSIDPPVMYALAMGAR